MAVFQHHHPVRHRQRFFLVVGDEHKGNAQLPLQPLELHLHGAAQLEVQGRQGFVQQQHFRPLYHRPGNRNPLLLAARKLMRFTPGKVFQLHHGQGFFYPLADFLFWPFLHLQAIGHVVEHRHMGEQRVVLEHRIQRTVLRRRMGQILPAKGDGPFIRVLETRHHPQQGGFSATGRP